MHTTPTRQAACLIAALAAGTIAAPALPSRADPPASAQPPRADPPASAPAFNPDRPGIADGSTLVGAGKFQIEAGVQTERHQDAGITTRLQYTPTLLRYGLDDRYELRVETAGYQHSRTSDPAAGTSSTAGYSPVSVGFKYHFQDAKPSTHNLSLGTIMRIFPASGSSAFLTDRVTGDLRLVADWNVSPLWSINPNIGVGVYEDGQGSQYVTALLPITIGYAVNSKIGLFVEPALQTPESKSGSASLIYDGGVTYLTDPSSQLDFSIGTGASGRTPPHPFIGLGYSHRFGG